MNYLSAEINVNNMLLVNLQHRFFLIKIDNINETLTNYLWSQVEENICLTDV